MASLLENAALLESEAVANSTMNRDRGLQGVNSYERDLRFDIVGFLHQRVAERGSARWYDACCGTGRALVEASTRLANEPITLFGVDLYADTATNPYCIAADVVTYRPAQPADLITCVHGLHYLGDKLAFLENIYAALQTGGLFIGHLDPANFRFTGSKISWARLLKGIQKSGVSATFSSHRLTLVKSDAPLRLTDGLIYQGASVAEGPNYTGMIGVDSWYEEKGE